jgi:hypothetical protein
MELLVIPVHQDTRVLLDLLVTRVSRVQLETQELQVQLALQVTREELVILDRLEHRLLLSLL